LQAPDGTELTCFNTENINACREMQMQITAPGATRGKSHYILRFEGRGPETWDLKPEPLANDGVFPWRAELPPVQEVELYFGTSAITPNADDLSVLR
jgi:hypothetical protein